MRVNRDAEMAVIGSCLISPDAVKQVSVKLKPEHFFIPAHKFLYFALCLLSEDGKPIDLMLLYGKIREIGRMEECGGEDYVLSCAQCVPSSYNAEYYADLVLDAWARREYEVISEMAGDEEIPLDELHIRAEAIKQGVAVAANRVPVTRVGFADQQKIIQGLSSGWGFIDNRTTCGGFPKSQITLFGASTGHGKTVLITTSMIHSAKCGRKVLYATFGDMNDLSIQGRIMKHETGWNKTPTSLDHLLRYDETLKRFQTDWHIDVYDASAIESGYDIETFAVWLDAQKTPYEIVFIDHAQELRSRARKGMTPVQEAEECGSVVARLAMRQQIPIIVASQVTKNDKVIYTKGARAWEEKAGFFALLEQVEEADRAIVTIQKNRYGPKKEKFDLPFDQGYVRYRESA